MKATNVLSVRLDSEDLERLKAEAARMGMRPGALAQTYIRAGLAANGEAEAKRRRGLAALERLARLPADLPPIDALKVAREAREELERRSII